MAEYAAHYDALFRELSKPFDQVSPEIPLLIERVSRTPGTRTFFPPKLQHAWLTRVVQQEAKLRSLAVRCAIVRFTKRHGAPPGTLSQLVPDCIEELPLDPYSGTSFRYHVKGERWRLYSVGSNRVDDDGTFRHDRRGRPAYGSPDIVFLDQLPSNAERRSQPRRGGSS